MNNFYDPGNVPVFFYISLYLIRMKKLVFVLLVFLPFVMNAQDNYDKETLRKLALMMADTDQMETRKTTLSSHMILPEKKDDFIKAYDEGVNQMLTDCESFFRMNYTPSEVKELLAFYETPAGKKLAEDTKRLISGYFPKWKEWRLQLHEMDKKEKEDKKKQQ